MKYKYVERRQRSNHVVWAVNPGSDVRDALEIGYEQYSNLDDANSRSQEITDAYEAYKKGISRNKSLNENTILGLVEAYKRTNSYVKLSKNSKHIYNQLLREALGLRLGDSNIVLKQMLSRNLTVSHSEQIHSQLSADVSVHRATHVCKVLRRIWFVGMRLGKVRFNPFQKMGLASLPSRTVLWTPAEVATFIETADKNGLRSVGTLALLCYDLCQRPGDMRHLTWSNYSSGVFDFIQEKTKTRVEIPASPRLVDRMTHQYHHTAFVDRWNRPIKSNDQHVVLFEHTGKPYDRRMYSKVAAKVRNLANLSTDLQIRDLRRTGATEMAESGCTEDELRSVTGHQSRDVLSIYVRPTTKLAAAGINKRFT
jgi:integrase|tara:strand:+ start:3604 stop:4707 length:1104 start_codon:yes stop_codon:yes gene_type:complete